MVIHCVFRRQGFKRPMFIVFRSAKLVLFDRKSETVRRWSLSCHRFVSGKYLCPLMWFPVRALHQYVVSKQNPYTFSHKLWRVVFVLAALTILSGHLHRYTRQESDVVRQLISPIEAGRKGIKRFTAALFAAYFLNTDAIGFLTPKVATARNLCNRLTISISSPKLGFTD
nr:hypothetical protein [Salmonella sp.]